MDKETHRILRDLDVKAAERRVFKTHGFTTDRAKNSLAGLHKARLMMRKAFTKSEIKDSEEWLDANGFKRPGAGIN